MVLLGLSSSKDKLADPKKLAAMRRRLSLAKTGSESYEMLGFNCQHFATYLRDGVPESPVVNALDCVLSQAASDVGEVMRFLSASLAYQPGLGALGNFIWVFVLVAWVLCCLLGVCVVSLAAGVGFNYMHLREAFFSGRRSLAAAVPGVG
jgi:hypothetical protein